MVVRDRAQPNHIADSRARANRCHLSEKALVDASVASPSSSSYSAVFVDDPLSDDFDFPVNRRAMMDVDDRPLNAKIRTLNARVTIDATSSRMFISHGFLGFCNINGIQGEHCISEMEGVIQELENIG